MAAHLTADLIARGVIAAAVSYGDDPAHALEIRSGANRRSIAPAADGIAMAIRRQLREVAALLGVDPSNIAKARKLGGLRYVKAREAAQEAIAYHLRTEELKSRRAQKVTTPLKDWKAEPRPKGRAIPRGAVVRSLGEGVQVIRLKPVTDSIVRHAKPYVQKGMPVEEIAELFDVDADSLTRGLKAVGVEVAA